MRTRTLKAAWQITAPQGHNRIAQGFNPGYRFAIGCALEVAPDRIGAGNNIRESDDVHRLWCPFRPHGCMTRYPGLKPWAILLRPFGAGEDDDKYRQPRRLVRHSLSHGRSLRRREYDQPGNPPHP